jgi:hypothetical protein
MVALAHKREMVAAVGALLEQASDVVPLSGGDVAAEAGLSLCGVVRDAPEVPTFVAVADPRVEVVEGPSQVELACLAPVAGAGVGAQDKAARLAGYRSPRTLHKAAREGRLRTTTTGPLGTRVTTKAWLEVYLASIEASKGHRGRPRSAARAAELEDLD